MVESYLGGWMRVEGQLSSDMAAYLRELAPFRGRITPLDLACAYYDAIEGLMQPRVRKWFNRSRLFRYSWDEKRWM